MNALYGWTAAVLALLTLSQLFSMHPATPSTMETLVSSLACVGLCSIDWPPTPCDPGDPCCPPLRLSAAVSLLVVLPAASPKPSRNVQQSWHHAALDEIIIVVWGGCMDGERTGAAAHLEPGILDRARLFCAPNESEWRPARALNLAAQASSGRLLLVASLSTALPGSAFEELRQAPGAFLHDSSATMAVPRSAWSALKGWDERLGDGWRTSAAPSPPDEHAAEGLLMAANAELRERAVLRGYTTTRWSHALTVQAEAADHAGPLVLLREWESSMVTPTFWHLSSAPSHAASEASRSSAAVDRSPGHLPAEDPHPHPHPHPAQPPAAEPPPAATSGWCVAQGRLRPPQASAMLREPLESMRESLRQGDIDRTQLGLT